MDLDQENLNLVEAIESVEEVNYDDLLEGWENECEEDNNYRMFLLDESAPKAAENIFESLNLLQYIQSEKENEDVESDDEFHMIIDSDDEEDLVISNTLPTKLSPCVIVDNSKGEIFRCCSTEKLVSMHSFSEHRKWMHL